MVKNEFVTTFVVIVVTLFSYKTVSQIFVKWSLRSVF